MVETGLRSASIKSADGCVTGGLQTNVFLASARDARNSAAAFKYGTLWCGGAGPRSRTSQF